MMLANGEREMVMMVLIFGFIITIIGLTHLSRHRQARLKLIDRALQSGQLDDAMRRQLVEAVSGPGLLARFQQHLAFLARHALFVLGWVGVFTGLGISGYGGLGGEEDLIGTGALVFLASLGVATIPLALRELRVRRRA